VTGANIVADDKDPFLKRWSKQKLADAEPEGEEVTDLKEEQAVATVDENDAPPPEIDPADLPDIETLDAESDFTSFLQAGVPEQLKRAALQKLWRSSPDLAVLDGLNDYDEDFSLVEGIVKAVTSAYRPGKGYADDDEVEEIEDDKLDETNNTGEEPLEVAADEMPSSDDEAENEVGDSPDIEQNQGSIVTPSKN